MQFGDILGSYGGNSLADLEQCQTIIKSNSKWKKQCLGMTQVWFTIWDLHSFGANLPSNFCPKNLQRDLSNNHYTTPWIVTWLRVCHNLATCSIKDIAVGWELLPQMLGKFRPNLLICRDYFALIVCCHWSYYHMYSTGRHTHPHQLVVYIWEVDYIVLPRLGVWLHSYQQSTYQINADEGLWRMVTTWTYLGQWESGHSKIPHLPYQG
jgi:hypothetical protein